MEDNVQDLVSKMVETEREEMIAMQPPELDIDDQYYTSVGITLFQMVDQNVREQTELHVVTCAGNGVFMDNCGNCRYLP